MIDYSRIKDSNYIASLIADINSTDDSIRDKRILGDMVKNISAALKYGRVEYDDVSGILVAINSRINSISQVRGKRISLSTNQNNRTAISDSRGVASIIFIVVNIAITTIMYTLLLIAQLIR